MNGTNTGGILVGNNCPASCYENLTQNYLPGHLLIPCKCSGVHAGTFFKFGSVETSGVCSIKSYFLVKDLDFAHHGIVSQ